MPAVLTRSVLAKAVPRVRLPGVSLTPSATERKQASWTSLAAD